MEYRREIDGLRAVAVLPVIFFHAGFILFEGGYIGVDVFFVISGYLITSIILGDINKGNFSIITFYERRARRILPALFFVMFCCLPFAWFFLIPSHLKSFSKSLAAVSVFSSNILFWQESGYFDTAAELKPLLHTWSLAVEEQYYLLFPLFLLALWKLRKRMVFSALVAVAAVSLAAAQWGAYNQPEANFFLLPTRGWELAIGALIGFYFLHNKEQSDFIASHRIASEILGAVGMCLICYSVFAFKKTTPFPSIYAIVPTIGTALIIIFSTSKTIVGRLLGTKPMVGIGIISYSAYLWHQPVFSFTRHQCLEEPSTSFLIALSAFSIILAYFSWRFVEIPFRDKNIFGRKKIFCFSLAGSLFFATLGIIGDLNNGFKKRFTEQQLNVLDFYEYDKAKYMGANSCFLEENRNYTDFSQDCYKNMNEKSALIWGDSYAAALSYGLKQSLDDVYQLTASKCPPIYNINTSNKKCKEINNFVRTTIINKKPAHIFLHANWMGLGGWKTTTRQKFISTISDIKTISPKSNIIIIGGIPQWPNDLPILLFKKNLTTNSIIYMQPMTDTLQFNKTRDIDFNSIAKEFDVKFFSLTNIFCKTDVCTATIPSGTKYVPLSFDYGHLTADASVFAVKAIMNSGTIERTGGR